MRVLGDTNTLQRCCSGVINIQSKRSQMLSARCTVVHQVKKQSTEHVSLGLGVPPCQHDRSLLHTERLWCLEVAPRLRNDAPHTLYRRPAPTEEVDVPAQR